VSTYTAEAAQEILKKLQRKGWNLYEKQYSDSILDADKTVIAGPAVKLAQDIFYVILPAVERDRDPFAVSDALEKVMKKTEGQVLLPHGKGGVSLQEIVLRESDIGIQVTGHIVGITYPTFIAQLDRIYDTTLEKQINYSKIDTQIREMVQKMNQVPFVYTLKSRAGKILKEIWRDLIEEPLSPEEQALKNPKVVARSDEEQSMMTEGYVIFTAREHPQARDFLLDLKAVASKYSFATLDCSDKKWKFHTDFRDLTRHLEVEEGDDFVARTKKEHGVPVKKAEKRIKDFQSIRYELMKIAEKYL